MRRPVTVLTTLALAVTSLGTVALTSSPSAAADPYAVLSYSGLGFGGSDCKITLDDPDWDGVAGRQLVSYLGGAGGIGFLDDAHTQPAPVLDVVKQDAVAHD